jgi:hypothetical protein
MISGVLHFKHKFKIAHLICVADVDRWKGYIFQRGHGCLNGGDSGSIQISTGVNLDTPGINVAKPFSLTITYDQN